MLEKKHEQKENAVSPVVGVMLMLVVTVILAAVVAAFAGGIADTETTTPTIVAKTEFWSPETYVGSGYAWGRFVITVETVSEPIQTKDLKLVTKWTNSTGATGGNTTLASMKNTNYSTYHYNSPLGFGPGVSGTILTSGQYKENQWFGNYYLTSGTSLVSNGVYGAVSGNNVHTAGDGLDGIFGNDWSQSLKKGDVVSVQLIYLPTNTVIYSDEVMLK